MAACMAACMAGSSLKAVSPTTGTGGSTVCFIGEGAEVTRETEDSAPVAYGAEVTHDTEDSAPVQQEEAQTPAQALGAPESGSQPAQAFGAPAPEAGQGGLSGLAALPHPETSESVQEQGDLNGFAALPHPEF